MAPNDLSGSRTNGTQSQLNPDIVTEGNPPTGATGTSIPPLIGNTGQAEGGNPSTRQQSGRPVPEQDSSRGRHHNNPTSNSSVNHGANHWSRGNPVVNMAMAVQGGPKDSGFVQSLLDFPPLGPPPHVPGQNGRGRFGRGANHCRLTPHDARVTNNGLPIPPNTPNGYAPTVRDWGNGPAPAAHQFPTESNGYINSGDNASSVGNAPVGDGQRDKSNKKNKPRGRRGDGRQSRSQRSNRGNGSAPTNQINQSNHVQPHSNNFPNYPHQNQQHQNNIPLRGMPLPFPPVCMPSLPPLSQPPPSLPPPPPQPMPQRQPISNVMPHYQNVNIHTTNHNSSVSRPVSHSHNINIPLIESYYTSDYTPASAVGSHSNTSDTLGNNAPRTDILDQPALEPFTESPSQRTGNENCVQTEADDYRERHQGLQSELEEEMARAQQMNLPVIFESKKQLNPKANEFEPPEKVKDAYGKPFKMTHEKGNCLFSPHTHSTRSNPKFVISAAEIESTCHEEDSIQNGAYNTYRTHLQHHATQSGAANHTVPPEQNTVALPYPPYTSYPPPRQEPAVDPHTQYQQIQTNPVMYPNTYTLHQTGPNGQLATLPQSLPHAPVQDVHQNQTPQAPHQTPQILHIYPPQIVPQQMPHFNQPPPAQHTTPPALQTVLNTTQLPGPQPIQPTDTQTAYLSPMVNSPYFSPPPMMTTPTHIPGQPYPPNAAPVPNMPPPNYPGVNFVPVITPNQLPLTPISGTPGTPNSIPTPQGQPVFCFAPPVVPDAYGKGTPIMNLQAYWATIETDNPDPAAPLKIPHLPQIDSKENDSKDEGETKLSEKVEMDMLARQICEKFIKFVRRYSTLGSDKSDAELTDELLSSEQIRNLYQPMATVTDADIENIDNPVFESQSEGSEGNENITNTCFESNSNNEP